MRDDLFQDMTRDKDSPIKTTLYSSGNYRSLLKVNMYLVYACIIVPPKSTGGEVDASDNEFDEDAEEIEGHLRKMSMNNLVDNEKVGSIARSVCSVSDQWIYM